MIYDTASLILKIPDSKPVSRVLCPVARVSAIYLQ